MGKEAGDGRPWPRACGKRWLSARADTWLPRGMSPEAPGSKPKTSREGNMSWLHGGAWVPMGGLGLAVPGQPVVHVVQISTQEY